MIRIIAKKNLYQSVLYKQCPEAIEAWCSIVEQCEWKKPNDIKNDFNSADLLGKKNNKPETRSSQRVVFDIKGNNARIIAKYKFHPKLKEQILYIKWIGSHKEYDELCKNNYQYEIEMF